jgi:formiminotetrahydrofolate cyclodeaminase
MGNDNLNEKAYDVAAFRSLSCDEFAAVLASKAPVPGGGGASALVGALGAALGAMVCNLTLGKKKYADVQDDITGLLARTAKLQGELLELIVEDARNFEPLSRAYGLPADTENEKAVKAKTMESALRIACEPPLKIMKACCAALDIHLALAEKGAAIAISDVGAGAALCGAAMQAAALNVFINTRMMRDESSAAERNALAEELLQKYIPMAGEIYANVRDRFR